MWKVKVKSLSRVRLLATPWTAAYQAPPSMGFSRQKYWSGVPLPSLKDGWAPKNWCFQIVVLEKTLESFSHSKEIKPVNPKENQPWMFIGRTKAEVPVLWLPDMKSWLIGKDCCWERLRARREGRDREWDGWMASLTQWTWVWTNSGRQWRTGQPGVLQSIGLQRIRHNLATEPQQFGKCIYSSAQCQWMANSKYSIKQWAFIIYNDMK